MPVKNYSELKKKPLPSYKEQMIIDELIDVLEAVNDDRQSFLREDLTPYIKALKSLKHRQGYSIEELNNHLNTLNGLGEFLVGGDGMANYKRILTDAKYSTGKNSIETTKILNEGIQFVSDYLDLGIDLKEVEKKAEQIPVNLNKLRIDLNKNQVNSKELLMSEKEKGKTFMNPDSRAYRSVETMKGEFSKAIEELRKPDVPLHHGDNPTKLQEMQAKIPANERKELADSLEAFVKAVDVLQSENPSEKNVQNALKTVRDFNTYLTKGINGSNYNRYLNAGIKATTLQHGLEAIDNTLLNGLDMGKIKKAKGYTVVEQKADAWIKTWKDQMKRNPDAFKVNAPETKRFLARIMATRMLVNSVRNHGEAFEKNVTNLDIDKKTDELLRNEIFAEFIDKIAGSKKGLEEAGKAISNGHCGGLDDAFKKYMLNLPAGQMPNDPLLGRYMPKVIDRIEVLQNMAKFKLNSFSGRGELPKSEVAEIYALRGMIRTPGGKKDYLKVDVPTDKNLKEITAQNLKDDYFKKIHQKKDFDLFLKGHGGDFAQRELKNGKIKPGSPLWLSMNAGNDDNLENLYAGKLNMNSYRGRMDFLKLKAFLLKKDLEDAIEKNKESEETKALCDKVYDLILEGCALQQDYNERKEKNSTLDSRTLGSTMDPERVARIKFGLDRPDNRTELFGDKPINYLNTITDFTLIYTPEQKIKSLMFDHEDKISWNPDNTLLRFMNQKPSQEEIKEIREEIIKENPGVKMEDFEVYGFKNGPKNDPKNVQNGPKNGQIGPKNGQENAGLGKKGAEGAKKGIEGPKKS